MPSSIPRSLRQLLAVIALGEIRLFLLLSGSALRRLDPPGDSASNRQGNNRHGGRNRVEGGPIVCFFKGMQIALVTLCCAMPCRAQDAGQEALDAHKRALDQERRANQLKRSA